MFVWCQNLKLLMSEMDNIGLASIVFGMIHSVVCSGTMLQGHIELTFAGICTMQGLLVYR